MRKGCFNHIDYMLRRKAEALLEIIYRADFAEFVFDGDVIDVRAHAAVESLAHGAVQAADPIVIFSGDNDARISGAFFDELLIDRFKCKHIDDPGAYTVFFECRRGLQSLVGAAVLGEFSTFSMDSVTPLSAGALLYLVIFGAIIAYTCYFWLLLHTRTVVAISYEYVNPVIGVFLGWLLAGEQVDGVIVTACCLTVLSVFFIVSRKHG